MMTKSEASCSDLIFRGQNNFDCIHIHTQNSHSHNSISHSRATQSNVCLSSMESVGVWSLLVECFLKSSLIRQVSHSILSPAFLGDGQRPSWANFSARRGFPPRLWEPLSVRKHYAHKWSLCGPFPALVFTVLVGPPFLSIRSASGLT